MAVNDGCHFCQTFAFARQFVISTDGGATLSDDAREQIWELSGQVAAVVRSDEPFTQLNADLDSLATQIDTVAVNDLQREGRHADVEDHRDVKEQDDQD